MDTLKIRRNRGKRVWLWVVLFILMIIGIGSVVPLPYYVYLPGSADRVSPMLTVDGGHKVEKGNLMLTTVYTLPATNIWYFLYGWMQPYSQVLPKANVQGPFDVDQYNRLQAYMMKSSKDSAEVAALRYLGKNVVVTNDGISVEGILPSSKAKGLLQLGDLITAIDGHPIRTSDDLLALLKQKEPGQTILVTFKRGGTSFTKEVPLIAMPNATKSSPKAGIGINQIQITSVKSPVGVHFKTGDIGGPSAGLMFTLEIISQLSGQDLTHGYQIAGTGTMDMQGNVGPIGGVEHKIVAAHRAGASYFLVPKGSNAQDAERQARKIGTKMRIIPVGSLTEAVQFLKTLPDATKVTSSQTDARQHGKSAAIL